MQRCSTWYHSIWLFQPLYPSRKRNVLWLWSYLGVNKTNASWVTQEDMEKLWSREILNKAQQCTINQIVFPTCLVLLSHHKERQRQQSNLRTQRTWIVLIWTAAGLVSTEHTMCLTVKETSPASLQYEIWTVFFLIPLHTSAQESKLQCEKMSWAQRQLQKSVLKEKNIE